MELTKYKISNFRTRKSRSEKTDFQESISENNKELFFAYIDHFKDKIDFNQDVNKTFTLLQQAYVSGFYKKDFTIFDFLYNQSSVDIHKESKSGETLLTLAAKQKDMANFLKFENDGIKDSEQVDAIYSFFNHLPILADKVNFDMLKYILKNPDYTMRKSIEWCLSGLNEYYYRTGKKEEIKNLLFQLNERGGLFWDNSPDAHKLLLYKAISQRDNEIIELILSNKTFMKFFKNSDITQADNHPIYQIIEQSMEQPNILDSYKKYPLPVKKYSDDYEFFSPLFKNKTAQNEKNVIPALSYLIEECKLNPFNESGRNIYHKQACISKLFEYSDNTQTILPLFKIIEKSEHFNINHIFSFDGGKFNILEYAYRCKAKDKTEILDYIKNHPQLNFNDLDNIEKSPLFLSIVNNDEVLFNKAMAKLDYSFKNKKQDCLIIHLLNYLYQKEYYQNIAKHNSDMFLKTAKLIVESMPPDTLNEIKEDYKNAVNTFKETCKWAVNANFDINKEQSLENADLIAFSLNSIFEKNLLLVNIREEASYQSLSKKRL